MRILRLVPLLAASLLMLTGCVPPFFACSAIGYGSVAHVELDEPRPGLQLELCDGEDCTPGPPERRFSKAIPSPKQYGMNPGG